MELLAVGFEAIQFIAAIAAVFIGGFGIPILGIVLLPVRN